MSKFSTVVDARSILAGDFLSPEDIQHKLDVRYSGDDIALLEKGLPNEYKLKQSRDQGVMLIAGPSKPMTLANICSLAVNSFGGKEYLWPICHRDPFGTDQVQPGWMLLRKEPFAESERKTWEQMCSLVNEPRFIPNVAQIAWAITVFKAVHGVFLFPEDYVVTSSSRAPGYHIMIGNCREPNRIMLMDNKDDVGTRWTKVTCAQRKFSM